ncbi:DeoR/GlpR family DNA-binding transcription regulator [Salinisphaera hydrothermalis]|uniref:Transcriptional regulator of sugar metabolism n=1 Tax=Salinisphaera hydrothermalis (strain C41B8) TaxID=1304275 RepID=A0A084IPY5_SALHC|nr:DeoR/GlpR family DNA-binding transcription regulator [Salinisphaera hydrothermalis]KEZ78769.1 transcriptional regulator of sugar metabolism [Salinisphaera hydrothermalis C41B8]
MERQTEILDFLCEQETASVSELAEHFGVSRMTIHRDISRLVDLRFVRKVRGGVTVLPSVVFESNYHYRARRSAAPKRALAQRVAEFIEPGMTVMLDDSSTTAALVEFLPECKPLTVITNAAALVETLREDDGYTVICLGGRYDPTMNAYLGMTCDLALEHLSADLAVFSVAGVQKGSAYLQEDALVRTKRIMKASVERSVLAFDSSKFGKSALHQFARLDSFDHVLTTSGADPAMIEELVTAGVPLEVISD